jgi:hypothetical protein
VLEALLDVNLSLLNSDTDSADLPLNRTQNIHHLSKASIITMGEEEQSERRRLLHDDHLELEEVEVLHLDPQIEAKH